MDEDIVFAIAGATTVVAGLGAVLTGWWLWLRSRTERLRGTSSEDIRALQDSVAALRTEIETMYTELSQGQQELHERLDFAERLLAQEQGRALPPRGDRPTA
jgi:hypothetical protein